MILLLNTRTEKIVTVKNNDNDQLIETMTSLMLIHYQYCQHGCLCIQTVVDQLKEPFLKKGLQMFVDGIGPEYIKDSLKEDLHPNDVYQNLVVEGVFMLSSNKPTTILEEKFKTYLSTEDQVKLEVVMTKGVLDDWKDHSETIEGGNQVIIEHLKQHEK